MIVIINGTLGVGKTETAWKLLEHFERAIMLDGDYLGAVRPFEIYDEQRIEYLYQTLRQLVAFHVEHGYHDFVIDYVFEQPESLARLRHLLSDLDDVIYAFRLTCAEDEIERRIRARNQALGRGPASEDLRWELNRFRELTAIQNTQALRGDLGFVVDTTARSVEQVAASIWQNIHEEVALASYTPAWADQYETERECIAAALGDLAVAIHHIGSTAVPGLAAKPVIDILIVVRQLDDATECIAPLRQLGYAFIDYAQNTDRKFFRKGLPRTHHVHIVAADSSSMIEHLAFRDALRSDPELRRQYAALKNDLAARYKTDRATYTESKTAFVRKVLETRCDCTGSGPSSN